MNNELQESGKKFLKSLAKHADLIMEAYVNKGIFENGDNEKSIAILVEKRVLWRPSSNADLHLTKTVKNLLEYGLRDERNRQIDNNMGARLDRIKTLIENYKEAKTKNRHRDYEEYLKEIGELVFEIKEVLKNNLEMLWTHIHNDFALVATLSAKIRENELAQKQVKSIMLSFEMLDFEELSELSGDDGALRHLLVVNLQHDIEWFGNELSEIQKRLFDMLGRFKKIQLRSKLIKGFEFFADNHPAFELPCYPERNNIPNCFNQATSINIQATADVNREIDEEFLFDLIRSLKLSSEQEQSNNKRLSQPIEIKEPESQVIELSIETQILEDFFCYLAEHKGEKISATQYYQQVEFNWTLEFWLFAVLGYWETMNAENQQYFRYKLIAKTDPVFTGNHLIEDICLWMN